MLNSQTRPNRAAHTPSNGPQRVVHDLLKVLLVLLGPGKPDMELGDLAAQAAQLGFGTACGVAGRQQLATQIDVSLLGWTDQVTQTVDLGAERGGVIGRSP